MFQQPERKSSSESSVVSDDDYTVQVVETPVNREFKQIATAGANTAAGSKFSQK